jgi:hypothetical protein
MESGRPTIKDELKNSTTGKFFVDNTLKVVNFYINFSILFQHLKTASPITIVPE